MSGWQRELDFANYNGNGYGAWVEERRKQQADLAHRLGLPLGREVEVWIRGGIRLRGKLLLQEQALASPAGKQIHLQVQNIAFTQSEIESCVRLD